MADIISFMVHLPETLLEEIKIKLQYARLDDTMADVEWNDLETGHDKFKQMVEYWRDEYDWREFEPYLNTFRQFTTPVPVTGFEDINHHFLHARSTRADAIPLLFVHGWPGSFLESLGIIPLLTAPEDSTKQALHVVAPSLPGYGFSSVVRKAGFGLEQHAECLANLMRKLGYENYVCQGGDWGSSIVRYMALNHLDAVLAIHINMFLALPPDPSASPEKYARYQRMDYSEQELRSLERANWFATTERGYQRIQETKPVTLGYALHDSPVGLLAWFAGKLTSWKDDYDWKPDEIIHWVMLHYQGSPSAAMEIYKDAAGILNEDPGSMLGRYISQPVGGSVFTKELWLYPREWMEEACNIRFWREHGSGGHFAASERPEALAGDIEEFFRRVVRET
ncbi:Alpha/Beta hydrolase protein [Aspergillus desertorum]